MRGIVHHDEQRVLPRGNEGEYRDRHPPGVSPYAHADGGRDQRPLQRNRADSAPLIGSRQMLQQIGGNQRLIRGAAPQRRPAGRHLRQLARVGK